MIGLKHCIQSAAALTAVVGLCLPALSAPNMEIVKNGQPNAVIVVDKDASSMVSFAAKELQTYLEKSSGAKLTISNEKPSSRNVIYVGESKYTKELGLSVNGFKPDQFRIISGDGWLALFGREKEPSYHITHPFRYTSSYDEKSGISRFGETGALYAVYRFLEKQCGIHWYMPGELGEVVPKTDNISIAKIDYTKAPDIPYRNIYWNEMFLGGNENLWYRRAGYGAPEPVIITHSFYMLQKYKQDHPEYFSLIDGERDFNKTSVGNGSLCLSNPGTLKAFVQEARDFFKANPGLNMFPVMPNDGWDRLCECSDCQKKLDKSMGPTGMFSDYVWEFVNKVGIELAKTNPGKMVGCCAYANYLVPPKHIEKLNSNVAVMICKQRFNYWDKEYQKKTDTQIAQWSKKTNNVYIWEYYLYASGYDVGSRGLPIFFPTIMSNDYKYLKNIIKGEFIEGESWVSQTTEVPQMRNKALITPNFYITGKLYWDVNLNPQKLMDQYCKDMYGPAATDMRRFWSKSEKLWMSKDPKYKKNHLDVYTPDAVNGLMAYIQAGLAKTTQGSVERKRIEALITDVKPTFDRINNPLIQNRPKLDVPFAAQAPVIDGTVDDNAWKNAVKINFVDSVGSKAAYATKCMLTWDDNNLYIAFVNEDPNPDGISVTHLGPDADFIWDDECNEMFFRGDSYPEGEYYQFIINAGADIWDAHFLKDTPNPQKWNSNAIAKSSKTKDGWQMEVSIPLSSLGLSNAAGKTIRSNIYRSRNNKDVSGASRSCWSPNLSAGYNAPDRMGYLTFKK